MDNPRHTAQFIFKEFRQSLYALYDRHETESITEIIFEHELQLSKIDLAVRKDLILEESYRKKIEADLELLLSGTPVQYVVGNTQFCGLTLKVTKDVLIPRQETEELVQWIVKENTLPSPKILDVCTGSGCIALALKNEIKNAEVTALDVSKEALEIAKKNASENHLFIKFFQKNILVDALDETIEFDILVSNPPYVKNSEKKLMHINVLNHEPHIALFVEDENPLIFYERIE